MPAREVVATHQPEYRHGRDSSALLKRQQPCVRIGKSLACSKSRLAKIRHTCCRISSYQQPKRSVATALRVLSDASFLSRLKDSHCQSLREHEARRLIRKYMKLEEKDTMVHVQGISTAM